MPHRPGMSGRGLSIGRDHHVAGAGADDLHQRAGLDAGADRAHVGVEGPHGHGHARRQADLRRDFRRERAGLLVGGQGAGGVALAEHGQIGIETAEELGAGQSAPGLVIHRLVPRRANAAGERVGIEIARDEGGNEVGQFHPGVGGLEDLGRRPLAMQDLRPVPLAAIGAAALVEILVADLLGLLRDLGRLGVAGVVFPEPGLRGKFVGELGQQGQRLAAAIDGDGRRAGRIDADADDALAGESSDRRRPPAPRSRRSDRSPRYSRPGSAAPCAGPWDRGGCPPRRWDNHRRGWRLRDHRRCRPPGHARYWCRNRRRWHKPVRSSWP